MDKKYFLMTILIAVVTNATAQVDSLIFINDNYIVGEIGSMKKNVLKIETEYSDNDFTIEWDGIKEIYTVTNFLVSLANGDKHYGKLKSTENGKIEILTRGGLSVIIVDYDDIVNLDEIEENFWKNIYASVDLGFDLTKDNNFSQISTRSNFGYLIEKWQLDGNYNILRTSQENTDDVKRSDANITYRYFLPSDWYPVVSVNFFSNTEQKLKLRTIGKAGFGKYLLRTNQVYWGFSVGTNYNSENFSVVDLESRKSWEGFAGTEFNLFNIGDLSMLTKLVAYVGLTESGRWRSDFSFDMNYDLPLDFYLKIGIAHIFDNQPAYGASKTDYVLHTGFGWEW
jgi:hypothetical protein